MHTVVIIGVGSPFGEDQLGWEAVDWLRRSGLHERFSHLQFTYDSADRPGALLLERLRGADGAIIIDAMRTGLPAGTLRAFTLEELLTQPAALLSSHAFGVAESLALGAGLGGLPRALVIIGIEMGDTMHGVMFAEETALRLSSLVEEFLFTKSRRAGLGC